MTHLKNKTTSELRTLWHQSIKDTNAAIGRGERDILRFYRDRAAIVSELRRRGLNFHEVVSQTHQPHITTDILKRIHTHLLAIRELHKGHQTYKLEAIDANVAAEHNILLASLDVVALENGDVEQASRVLSDLDKDKAQEKILLPVKWVPYEAESADETYLACPICESPPDDCTDQNHYKCEACDGLLDNCTDNHGNEFWDCAEQCKGSVGYYYEP